MEYCNLLHSVCRDLTVITDLVYLWYGPWTRGGFELGILIHWCSKFSSHQRGVLVVHIIVLIFLVTVLAMKLNTLRLFEDGWSSY